MKNGRASGGSAFPFFEECGPVPRMGIMCRALRPGEDSPLILETSAWELLRAGGSPPPRKASALVRGFGPGVEPRLRREKCCGSRKKSRDRGRNRDVTRSVKCRED